MQCIKYKTAFICRVLITKRTFPYLAFSRCFTYCCCSLITFKVLTSIVLLGKACHYTRETKRTASNSRQADASVTPPPSPTSLKRRLSDPSFAAANSPRVEEVARSSCLKRSRSLGNKLNVKFSISDRDIHLNTNLNNTNSSSSSLTAAALGTDALVVEPRERSASDVSATTALLNEIDSNRNLMPSNSTVSLQNVGLNEEFIKDSQQQQQQQQQQESQEGDTVPPESGDNSELKQRKPPPKPLNEIDRYTMCSNRII